MPIPQLNKNNNRHSKSWKNQRESQNIHGTRRGTNFNRKKKKSFSLTGLLFNKKTFSLVLILFVLGAVSVFGVFIWASQNLPNPNNLIQREVAQSTKIYDRTGEELLYEIHGEQQRTLVTIEEIPDHVEAAAVAMEDKNFYKHRGFSLLGIARAAITDIIHGEKKAGGSTITQQLVKNAILTPEKTYTRKIKELILAYRIEQKFSKEEILQLYLNEIPYGGAAYGVEAASRHYFGKNVKDINISEAATLAALPQAPSYYSPYGPNKELLLQRKNYIVKLMHEQGYITEKEMKKAQSHEPKFKEPSYDIKAPHFVMYIKSQLSQKYGQKMLEQGGLKIYTTLDTYKQKYAEEVVKEKVDKNIKNYNATNAGLVSIDPKTGQVLAMVGSRDYFDEEIDGKFNIATAKRQPGSSMKPIVYSSAFSKGFTPNTKLFDVVTNFSNNSNDSYEPKNYDLKERGPVSIRKALAGSLNIPAVKALYLAGMDNVFDLTNRLGYSTFSNRDRFGLSLVLGGGEVKLLEHTNAYSAFAREGVIRPVNSVLKIENSEGKVIEEYKNEERRVLETETARMINSILTDNEARAFTYGSDNYLTLDSRPVAAKTGTTNSYKDAWTIGYTPSLVTGVWTGNNNNTKMKRGASGGNVAAPIWNEYMKRVLGDTPAESFKPLGDIKTGKPAIDGNLDYKKTAKIDTISGLLATEHTPEKYVKEIEYMGEPHSILYYTDKENPLGPKPKNPEEDPQFQLWEEGVKKWVQKNEEWNLKASSSIPTKFDDVHKPEFRPKIEILSPYNKETITDKNIQVNIKASATKGVERAEYFINGNHLTTNTSYPYNLNQNISFLKNGYHDLNVKVCDSVGNCAEKGIVFNYKIDQKIKKTPEVSWVKPKNNLTLTEVDFPYTYKIKTTNPDQVAKIEININNNSEEKGFETKTWNAPSRRYFEWTWNKANKDTYTLTPKIYTWSGETKKGEEIHVNVN